MYVRVSYTGLARLHRDSEAPLRGNGANGKEISLGASSRRRVSPHGVPGTAADTYRVSQIAE